MMAKPATRSASKPAAAKPVQRAGAPIRTKAMEAKANEPEPAVMAAGASPENAEEGRGSPPADPPKPEDKVSDDSQAEGFRNDAGQFTGNPPTLEEKVDAIIDTLQRNGMSLGKVLSHGRE